MLKKSASPFLAKVLACWFRTGIKLYGRPSQVYVFHPFLCIMARVRFKHKLYKFVSMPQESE